MICFREGNREDTQLIARLHAESWKASYRGIVSDHYLDQEVDLERLEAWTSTLRDHNPNLHIIIAEDHGIACGFSGIYLDRSRTWGSYIDNLHVLPPSQGRGIGAQLLIRSADWIERKRPGSSFYLWVYTANSKARAFYEKMGCQYEDIKTVDNPGGGRSEIIRCVWPAINALRKLDRIKAPK